MSTHRQVHELWAKAAHETQAGALVTLVNVVGSSYQPVGARMLVTAAGEWAGMVSGGCLEADVLLRAREVIAAGTSVAITYDATGEEDVPLGFNLGCQGKVTLLIEPLKNAAAVLEFLAARRKAKGAGVIATVIATASGLEGLLARHLCVENVDEELAAGWLREHLSVELLRQAVATIFSDRSSQAVVYDGLTILWEYVAPPNSLLICGAGDDARPLSSLAQTLGWEVTVHDHRPGYLTAARFPAPTSLELWCDGAEISRWHPDSLSAAVLMTHHFERDERLLAWLLKTSCPYVGILGPKKRTQRLLTALRGASGEEAYGPIADRRLHSPVGLDIGAETPEAIALAVLAEAHAVLAGRSGAFLRATPGPLHRRQRRQRVSMIAS